MENSESKNSIYPYWFQPSEKEMQMIGQDATYSAQKLYVVLEKWVKGEKLTTDYSWENIKEWELGRYVRYAFPGIDFGHASIAVCWSAWFVTFKEWLNTQEGSLESSIDPFRTYADDLWVSEDFKNKPLAKSFKVLQRESEKEMSEEWIKRFREDFKSYFNALSEERRLYETGVYPDLHAYKNQRLDTSGSRIWMNLIEKFYDEPLTQKEIKGLEAIRTSLAEIFILSRDYYRLSYHSYHKSNYRLLLVLREKEKLRPLDCEMRGKEEIIKSVEGFIKQQKNFKENGEEKLRVYLLRLTAWAYGTDVWSWKILKIHSNRFDQDDFLKEWRGYRNGKDLMENTEGIYKVRADDVLSTKVKMKIPYTQLKGDAAYADAYKIFSGIYVMPEALNLPWLDEDGTSSDIIDTQQAKEDFVKGVQVFVKLISDGYSGAKLLEYIGDNSLEHLELKDGSKVGGVLIMAPSNHQTNQGIFHYELPYSMEDGIAGRSTGSVVAMYPHVNSYSYANYVEKGGLIDFIHSLLHGLRTLKGAYTNDMMNIFAKGSFYTDTAATIDRKYNGSYRLMLSDILINNRTEAAFNGIGWEFNEISLGLIVQDCKMASVDSSVEVPEKWKYDDSVYQQNLGVSFKVPANKPKNLEMPSYDQLLVKVDEYRFNFQNNQYLPAEVNEITPFTSTFTKKSWSNILSEARLKINNLIQEFKKPNLYHGDFTRDFNDLYYKEREIYTVFPSVVQILNQHIGNVPEILTNHSEWIAQLSRNVALDSLKVSNVCKFNGLSKTLADLLGIHPGLVDENVTSKSPETTMISVLAFLIPHKNPDDFESLILNHIYVDAEVNSFLSGTSAPSFDLEEYRRRRNINWRQFLSEQLEKHLIPMAEEIYLRAEQVVQASFAQILAMVEYRAILIETEAKQDLKKLGSIQAKMYDDLLGLHDDLLIKMAVNIKEVLYDSLLELLQQVYDSKWSGFTEQFMNKSRANFLEEYEEPEQAAKLFDDYISRMKEDGWEYSDRLQIVSAVLNKMVRLWPNTLIPVTIEAPLFVHIDAQKRERSHVDIDELKVQWMIPLNIPYALTNGIKIVFEEYDTWGNVIQTLSVPVQDEHIEILPMLPFAEDHYVWKSYFINNQGMKISEKTEIKYLLEDNHLQLQYDFKRIKEGELPIFRPRVGGIFRIMSSESKMVLKPGAAMMKKYNEFENIPDSIQKEIVYAELLQSLPGLSIDELWRLRRSYQTIDSTVTIVDEDYFIFENLASGMIINRDTLKNGEKIIFCSDEESGNPYIKPVIQNWGAFHLQDIDKSSGIGFKKDDPNTYKEHGNLSIVPIEKNNPLSDWFFVEASVEIPVVGEVYKISSHVNRLFLDKDLPVENGAMVVQWPKADGISSQLWKVEEFKPGHIKLMNMDNGQYISENVMFGSSSEEDRHYCELVNNPSQFYGQFNFYYSQGWNIFNNGTLRVTPDSHPALPIVSAEERSYLNRLKFTSFSMIDKYYYISFDNEKWLTHNGDGNLVVLKDINDESSMMQWQIVAADEGKGVYIMNQSLKLARSNDGFAYIQVTSNVKEKDYETVWKLVVQDKGWKIVAEDTGKALSIENNTLMIGENLGSTFTFKEIIHSKKIERVTKYYSIKPYKNTFTAIGVQNNIEWTSVVLMSYNKNDPKQQWIIEKKKNNVCTIKNVFSKKLIQIEGVFTGNGANAIQSKAIGGVHQEWDFIKEGEDKGVWKLQVQHSQKMLQSNGHNKALTQYEDTGDENQLWIIENILDDEIKISPKDLYLPRRNKEYLINFSASGLSIIYKWFNEPFGWPVRQAIYDGSSSFGWKFTPLGSNIYGIRIRHGLDEPLMALANNSSAHPVINNYKGNDAFKWKLEYLGNRKFGLVSVSAGDSDNRYIGIVKSEVSDIYTEREFNFQMVSKSDGNLYEWELIEPSEKYIYLPRRNKEYLINFSASGLPLIYKWFSGWPVRQAKYDGRVSSFGWKFTPLGSNIYRISIKDGQDQSIMALANNSSENHPIIKEYQDNDAFKWKLEYLGNRKFGLVSVSAGDSDNRYIGIVKSEVSDIYTEREFNFQMVSKSDGNLYEWELIEPSEKYIYLPKGNREYLINFNASGLPLIYKWFNEPFGWPVRQAGYDG
ncbi:hypothetical protein IQ37_17045, partial [Chryseobacterium piperi]